MHFVYIISTVLYTVRHKYLVISLYSIVVWGNVSYTEVTLFGVFLFLTQTTNQHPALGFQQLLGSLIIVTLCFKSDRGLILL